MTLAEHVAAGAARLGACGLPPDEVGPEAAVLARHVLDWTPTTYLCRLREPAPEAFGGRYAAVLDRRARREPVSSILGQREFWGLRFEVDAAVLTPRPETELLVEETLRIARRKGGLRRIIDAGTGSGCVGIALATELPSARIVATDISTAALAVARRNAARHHVGERMAWVRTSWLDGLSCAADVIVANPPYVRDDDLERLPPEVRGFDPRLALAGGADGLDAVRTLLHAAECCLPAGGHLVMEVGADQMAAVRAAACRSRRLAVAGIRRDLQDIERAIVITRPTAGSAQ